MPRKSLSLPQLIAQHIAAKSRPVNAALLLALAASAQAQQGDDTPMHYGWHCSPAGSGWDCRETLLPGATGQRPVPAGSAAQPEQHKLDWVDEQYMSDEQKALKKDCCDGAYIEPARDYPDADKHPDEVPARAEADHSELVNETTAVFEGSVEVTQGYRQLHADKAQFNQANNQADLDGSVTLREPGLLLLGDNATVDMNSDRAQLNQAQFVLHQQGVRGEAENIQKIGDNLVVLTDGGVTSCKPESNTWLLKGSEIELDQASEMGTVKHMRMNVQGVPVFYLPYATFPIGDTRKSGFLYPALASSGKNGVEVATPYYFNLAPNYDATLTPRYLTERGLVLEAEGRHLSKHFSTVVSGAYLDEDKGGAISDGDQSLIDDGLLTEAEATPYKDKTRWLIDVDQRGGLGQRWFTDIDYTEVSDRDFFRDLDTQTLEVNSQTHLLQRAAAGYSFNNWSARIRAEQYQSVSNAREQYRRLPTVNLDGRYRFGDVELSLLHDYSAFDHRDIEDNDNLLIGDRARADYQLAWDKHWVWGHFKPAVGASGLAYKLDDKYLLDGANDSPDAFAGMASLDAGLVFEREGLMFGSGYVQTFEPRLFHLYREADDGQREFYNIARNGRGDINFDTAAPTFSYGQLFRDSRFVGGDRIDDANQTSIGLTTRFIGQASGAERLRLSIGQIFYHDDRKVDLNYYADEADSSECIDTNGDLNCFYSGAGNSEIAMQISGQLSDNWRLTSDVLYDPYTDELIEKHAGYDDSTSEISRASVALRYLDDDYRILNLAYRFERRPMVVDSSDTNGNGSTTDLIDGNIEQADASLVWPIAGNWNLIARSLYDLNYERELETFAGLEYDSCCYRLRLVGRKWLDNRYYSVPDQSLEHDTGVFFEILFKGLGSTSKEVSNIMKDGIINYDRRERALQ